MRLTEVPGIYYARSLWQIGHFYPLLLQQHIQIICRVHKTIPTQAFKQLIFIHRRILSVKDQLPESLDRLLLVQINDVRERIIDTFRLHAESVDVFFWKILQVIGHDHICIRLITAASTSRLFSTGSPSCPISPL